MKKLNNFIAWLYIMVTITLGLLLIVSVSGWYGFREGAELFISEQLNSTSGIWTGIALVIIGLLLLNLRIKEDIGARTITFDNPEGEITISIKAIEEFVKKVGQEFHNVIEMTPTVIVHKTGIKVRAKTSIETGANVPRLAESIQHTIKIRMQNILGIENVTQVEVYVSKLIAKEASAEEHSQQSMDIT